MAVTCSVPFTSTIRFISVYCLFIFTLFLQMSTKQPAKSVDMDHDLSKVSSISSDIPSDTDSNASEITQAELTSQISNISTLSQERKYQIERSITHYENIDKTITRMPQFYQADEFLHCLSQFTTENETLKDLGRFRNKLYVNQSEDDIRYEIIIENQRGATLFGNPIYSKESVLYPLDPPKYQTLCGMNLTSLSMYPDPGDNWRWCWNNWHVMMINDVDEEGWIYSRIRFGSYKWKGVGKFGNFVRRRIWVRMIERIVQIEEEEGDGEEEEEEENGLQDTIWLSPTFKDSKKNWVKADNRYQNSNKTIPAPTDTLSQHAQTNETSFESNKIEDNNGTDFSNNPTTDSSDADDYSIKPYSEQIIENDDLKRKLSFNEISSDDLTTIEEPISNISENKIILLNIHDKLLSCKIDRVKIQEFLDFLFSADESLLEFLISDFETTQEQMTCWLARLLFTIHFHDSRKLFLERFKERYLADNDNNTYGQKRNLKKVYKCCGALFKGILYDSEKR